MRYIYQNVVQDGRGNFVASATVTVTLAGGSTKASIYSALTGGTVDADGIITTGADGTFAFYVDESDYSHSQQFRIVWSKSGFTSETWDYIQIFPDGDRTLLTSSTVDQGDADIVGTLAWHVADISTDSATITVLPGTYTISQTITIPKTMTIRHDHGAIFADDASNADLTINGLIEAGDYQIFSWGNGSGTLSIGDNNPTIVNPYWHFSGTKNSGDEYAAFTEAIAMLGNGCSFVVPAGEHYVSDTVEFAAKYRLTVYWNGRLAPYDTFDDYLVYFGIATGDTADPEIADLGMNLNVVGHIRLNCLNDSATTLQQARGMRLYGVYLSHFAPITVLGASGTSLKMVDCYENYFEGLWSQGSKNRDAFATPAAWASGSTYANGDKVFRD